MDVVGDECGPKIKVVLEEGLRLVVGAVRDESPAKVLEQRREVFRLAERAQRDEREAAGLGP